MDARSTHVESGCVWCKQPVDDDAVRLDTGEAICDACLGDCREWKRTRQVDLLVTPALDATTRSLLLSDWRDLRDRLVEIHDDDDGIKAYPTRTSNAYDTRQHPDGSAGTSNE